MARTISPSEEELKKVVVSLKSANPTFGIAKIHGLLLAAYPEWTVSEKRTRKALQSEGLILQSGDSSSQSKPQTIYPSSKLIPNLDVGKWTPKVEVKHFNKKKGKGLVAKQDIQPGDAIWREDPYIVAAEWEIYDLQISSQACSFCTTPFSSSTTTSLLTNCTASTSSSYCPARFCNRLCRDRSARTHPLLCPAQNPASVPLLKWAREAQWMALHALACMTSRILTLSQDPNVAEEEWRIVSSFATLSLEDRAKYHFHSSTEPDEPQWRKAFQLYVQAFNDPATLKKLARIIKKPVKTEIAQGLFQYDAFLRNLGKMSLNLEAHGGLYTLHSHLNHSCDPNVSVRHLDQRTALSRITVIAREEIEPGEELTITYVNPQMDVRKRQQELEAWGFGKCACERCRKEEKELPPVVSVSGAELGADSKGAAPAFDMADLEKELKAGLGVM